MKFQLILCSLFSFTLAQDSASAPDNDALNKALDSLCSADKSFSIPACSLRHYCTSDKSLSSSDYCSPGALFASICSYDKKTDSNCKDYTSKCGTSQLASTNSKYCANLKPIPNYVSSNDAAEALSTICGHHDMPSCSAKFCPLDSPPKKGEVYSCDQLTQLRTICLDMSTMDECAGWNKMCDSTKKFGPLCTNVKLPENNGSTGSSSSSGKGSSSSAFRAHVGYLALGASCLGFFSS
ncbi:hypothetical protein K502DRAFT_91943 [Neoconidiobolus thromboides FSU 785]|nr:hypothetical protein K502DRAFT_91943 [Neoconidiobolus thromboides FSU 785]